MGFMKALVKGIARTAKETTAENTIEKQRRTTANRNPNNHGAGNDSAAFCIKSEPLSGDIIAENHELYLEGVIKKMKALGESGVDVFSLTDEKMIEDAIGIANNPCGIKIKACKQPTQVDVHWQNLTKTGKVPKKVAESSVVFDWKSGDSVIVHVWYLASIEPYGADVYLWKGNDRTDFSVRSKNGSLVVEHKAKYNVKTDYREPIF